MSPLPPPSPPLDGSAADLSRRRCLSLLAATPVAAAVSLGLGGCASRPAAAPAGDATVPGVVVPNEQLLVQGIPPIPQALADEAGPYNDFRGARFVEWHPRERRMLIAQRPDAGGSVQLFSVDAPLAAPRQLTDGADTVRNATWEPRLGRYFVFARAQGGNEAYQLYRQSVEASAAPVVITPADERHSYERWLHTRSELFVTSVPLDRTASGGSRAKVSTRLWLVDPMKPSAARTVAQLPGSGWGVACVSRDDRLAALLHYHSATHTEVHLLDIATGKLVPAAGASGRQAVYFPVAFAQDGRSLVMVSDVGGEFRELMLWPLDGSVPVPLSRDIPWDAERADLSDDGRLLAAQFNVGGRDELRLYDMTLLAEVPMAALPAGAVALPAFRPGSHELAMTVDSSQGPSQVWSTAAGAGPAMAQWTRAYAPPGLDPKAYGDQQIVRWKSFDGLTISGIVNRAPARFPGRRPVLVLIHGGPEGQATMGFLGRYNYLVEQFGITLIQPNVRGSSGFGKTFLTLDNGRRREDSVKDIGALFDWIATQPDLDPSRVAVMGGSYGGYMSLAVATNYADRIVGAIDVVGISHFVTFLQNTESYRRDLRRVEYGDERDPAMRAFLDGISPLTNAQRIRKPLFVVQGRNDPRVPYTEAEQIVAKARAQGTTVWYLRAENEGHGFVQKANADFYFYAVVMFLRRTLLLA